jgi:hypothetical protein
MAVTQNQNNQEICPDLNLKEICKTLQTTMEKQLQSCNDKDQIKSLLQKIPPDRQTQVLRSLTSLIKDKELKSLINRGLEQLSTTVTLQNLAIEGEYHPLSPQKITIRHLKRQLLMDLKKLHLSKPVEQSVTLALLNMKEPSLDGKSEPDVFNLEKLFLNILQKPCKDSIAPTLKLPHQLWIPFLQKKALKGNVHSKKTAISLLGLLPRAKAIETLFLLCEQADVKEHVCKTLLRMKSQKSFSKFSKPIDTWLSKFSATHQLLDKKPKDTSSWESMGIEEKISTLKSCPESIATKEGFLDGLWTREKDDRVKVWILRLIGAYRIRAHYPIIDEALKSDSQKLTYHCLLTIEDHFLTDVAPLLKQAVSKLRGFNRQYATRILKDMQM